MIAKLSSRCTAHHRTDLVTTTRHGVRAVLFRKQPGSPLPNQKKLLADANLSGAAIQYRQKLTPHPPPPPMYRQLKEKVFDGLRTIKRGGKGVRPTSAPR